VNEEEEPAQASPEAPAQDAPPPYSSVTAANAGERVGEASWGLGGWEPSASGNLEL